jgi:hypothetical protein
MERLQPGRCEVATRAQDIGFRLLGGEVDGFTGGVGGCVRVVRSVAKRFSD